MKKIKLLTFCLLLTGSLSFAVNETDVNIPKSGKTSVVTTETEISENIESETGTLKNTLSKAKLKIGKSEWKLVWRDEFDGNSLDMSRWSYWENGNPWNSGNYLDENGNFVDQYGFKAKHYYLKENVKVKDGNLVIELKKETDKTVKINEVERKIQYSSGAVHTKDKYSIRYGKIEMRAAMPKGIGVWPAFWTWPKDYSQAVGSPAKEEIDIVEAYGDKFRKIAGTAHALKSDNTYASFGGSDLKLRKSEDLTEFNTYAIEWDENKIKWYFNGRHYKTLSMKKVRKFTDNTFKLEHFLMINVALQEKTGEDGDINFPTEMKIDYVRVYKK